MLFEPFVSNWDWTFFFFHTKQRRKQPEDGDLHESKTLFINYLPKEVTDDKIKETLSPFGTVEKVTKIKDYAFVLFTDHGAAAQAVNGADKMQLGHENIEISLAMPKSMKTRQRPSFNRFRAYNQRNGRPRPSKRFNSSFGSSARFHMRHHKEATNASATDSHNDSTGATVEQTAAAAIKQTVIPMPIDTPINMPAVPLAH